MRKFRFTEAQMVAALREGAFRQESVERGTLAPESPKIECGRSSNGGHRHILFGKRYGAIKHMEQCLTAP